MEEWSSDPNDRYSFAGANIQALYQAFAEAVSTVTFTVFQGSFSSATVKPITRVSFDGNNIAFSTTGLAELCDRLDGGLTDTQVKVRADFLGASGAKVTLRDPHANICPGPPWRP
jgi:hypothetical protein